MTLGELKETLDQFDPSKPINGGGLISYRGYYNQLAITPDEGTVGMLLGECKYALNGGVFEGYKGGSYVMDEDTPVWYADYGEYPGKAVLGVKMAFDRVELITADITDYTF